MKKKRRFLPPPLHRHTYPRWLDAFVVKKKEEREVALLLLLLLLLLLRLLLIIICLPKATTQGEACMCCYVREAHQTLVRNAITITTTSTLPPPYLPTHSPTLPLHL
jgi:hypothetical protein